MLDDIVEIVLDIAGDVLEAVVSRRRKKGNNRRKQNPTSDIDPWERSDQAAPWEK